MVTVLLPFVATLLAYLGFTMHPVWLWPAAVATLTWFAYLSGVPQVFGKRPDGTQSPAAWLVWAPLFAYQWMLQAVIRMFSREPLASEVAPGVWVGRRPRARELPPGTAIVIDLCAEFPASRGITDGRRYLTYPTLDARAPRPDQIADAVDAVLAAGGPAFIHCAHGHGRSATVAAAVLVRRGDATLDDVEAKMKAKRPRIGLNVHQRTALDAATKLR